MSTRKFIVNSRTAPSRSPETTMEKPLEKSTFPESDARAQSGASGASGADSGMTSCGTPPDQINRVSAPLAPLAPPPSGDKKTAKTETLDTIPDAPTSDFDVWFPPRAAPSPEETTPQETTRRAGAAPWLPPWDDPRPDLLDDSARWCRLLREAWHHDHDKADGLFGALHGLRCLGATLISASVGVRLVRGAIDEEEYADLRQRYLVPHGAQLNGLLRRVRA